MGINRMGGGWICFFEVRKLLHCEYLKIIHQILLCRNLRYMETVGGKRRV